DQVADDQQLQILSWLLHRRGVSAEATALVEGALAMREQGAAQPEPAPPGAGAGIAVRCSGLGQRRSCSTMPAPVAAMIAGRRPGGPQHSTVSRSDQSGSFVVGRVDVSRTELVDAVADHRG